MTTTSRGCDWAFFLLWCCCFCGSVWPSRCYTRNVILLSRPFIIPSLVDIWNIYIDQWNVEYHHETIDYRQTAQFRCYSLLCHNIRKQVVNGLFFQPHTLVSPKRKSTCHFFIFVGQLVQGAPTKLRGKRDFVRVVAHFGAPPKFVPKFWRTVDTQKNKPFTRKCTRPFQTKPGNEWIMNGSWLAWSETWQSRSKQIPGLFGRESVDWSFYGLFPPNVSVAVTRSTKNTHNLRRQCPFSVH